MLYPAIFLLLIVLQQYSAQSSSRRSIYAIVLAALFLFAAFRYEVGCDWAGYLVQFDNPSEPDTDSGYASWLNAEPLWWQLISAINSLGLPYQWLNVVTSLLFFSGVHALARRQRDPLGFLVMLYPILILNIPMSGIRQGAALGILCFAFNAFADRKVILYVALVLLANSLHNSAKILLVFAPFVGRDITIRRALVAGAFAAPIVVLLLGSSAADVAISRYVDTGVEAFGAPIRVCMLAIVGAIFFWFLRRSWATAEPEYASLATLGASSMLALVALLPVSSVMADRVGYYLIPIEALIVSSIPFVRPDLRRLVLLIYGANLVLLAAWANYSTLFDLCYVPYRSWLFGLPAT